jgi:hypothetical protein
MSYLRGMRMELEKKREGKHKILPQNEGVKAETAERLANQYKVSRATIERDATYAADINKIAAVTDTQGPRIIMETEGKLGRKEVRALADLTQSNPEATKKVLHTLDSIDKPKVAKAVAQKAVEDIAEHGDVQPGAPKAQHS